MNRSALKPKMIWQSGSETYVCQIGRTEKIQNSLNPRFSKTLVIDYYFEMVQKLRFEMYDIDSDNCTLQDADFLGELECTLGQVSQPCLPNVCFFCLLGLMTFVSSFQTHNLMWCRCRGISSQGRNNVIFFFDAQIVSSRKLTRPLVMKDKSPAGKGSITVSCSISDWWWHLDSYTYVFINLFIESVYKNAVWCFVDLCWRKNR